MSQSKVIIGFGGNKGPTLDIFHSARAMIEAQVGICIKTAKVYRSRPMVAEGADPDLLQEFLNSAALFKTDLSPREVLQRCLNIEDHFGRIRKHEKKWESRTLDLDILTFDTVSFAGSDLIIPHPGLEQRDFVLYPLIDLDPNFIHPATNRSAAELLRELPITYVEGVLDVTF